VAQIMYIINNMKTALCCALLLGTVALGKPINLYEETDDQLDIGTLTNEKLQAAHQASRARTRPVVASTKRH